MTCPQCGEPTETLYEGVCEVCRKENQMRLDLHNSEYDWWRKLSNTEKDDVIRRACR